MNKKNLLSIKNGLKSKGYHCKGFNKDDSNLEVIIEVDAQHRSWTGILVPSSKRITIGKEEASFLEVYLQFPYGCKITAIPNLCRLLLLLNKGLLFPSFGFSEIEGVIYYRYTIYCAKDAVPLDFTLALIDMLLLYIDSLSPMIEAVANGEKEVHEVLKMVTTIDV